MNFKIKINDFRRVITRFFSENIFFNYSKEKEFNLNPKKVKKILISRPNHRLGNCLLITPLIIELNTFFPNAEIHLFVKGSIGDIVFSNFNKVVKVIALPRKPFKNLLYYFYCWTKLFRQKYDISFNASGVSSSGKLAVRLSNSKYKFYNIFNSDLSNINDYVHYAKNPIYNFKNTFFNKMSNKFPKLNIKLRDYEIKNGKKILKSFFKNDKPVIGIFTYATGKKCLSEKWWDKLYIKLRKLTENYNIIEILPIENISQINFRARSYYSKDIREIASLMHNLTLFIGADSGMMHLAHSSNTKTIGLFNTTSPKFYGVYGKGNVSVNLNNTSIDDLFNLIISKLD